VGEIRDTAIIDALPVDGPRGVKVIPAGSGLQQLTALSVSQWDRLEGTLDQIGQDFDYLIIDTAAGISDNVIESLASRVAGTEPKQAAGLRLVASSSRPRGVAAATPQCA
jgi:MinD-like ATPase involved in chromosome partitioning or flagellar assembly